ncbi:MAG TPA: hypothetical protein VKU41_12365 [Polyangiaceae bacterium]|nr:hypothetical protein [Polyangiaceae bacterium]
MAPPTISHRPSLRPLFCALSLPLAVACAQGVGDAGFQDAPPDASVAPARRSSGPSAADGRAPSAPQAPPDHGPAVADGAPEASASDAGDDESPRADASDAGDGGEGATDAVAADGSGDAGAPTDDAAGDDGSVQDVPAGVAPADAGDLLISEVMFYPSGPEPQSEWFEVYNLADSPRLLSGLTIQDGYPRTHVIASDPPVVAPSHAYVVLVRNQVAAVDELVPPASIVYEYGAGLASGQGIELENGTTGDVSLWNGGTLVADVPYGAWGMASVGQSIELGSLVLAGSDQAGAWCLAQYAWASGSDDGTPGAPNDCP